MPGSTEKAWPGASASQLPADDVRVLVLLDADAVAGAVDEVVAVAALGDDAPGDGVDVLARRADDRRRHRGPLRLVQHGVQVAELGRRLLPPVHTHRVMSEQ